MSATDRLSRSRRINDAATETAALPMGYATLVGTVLTPKGPRAYVHLGQGRIHKLKPREQLEGAIVTAIDNGVITLSRGNDSRQMRIAAS
jgi:hypothetical protein